MIEYSVPRMAMVDHRMDDGQTISVQCEVESYCDETDSYWISYIDPEDDDCCIADLADAEELTFMEQAS